MAQPAAKPFDFDDLGAAETISERVYSAQEVENIRREARDEAIRDLLAQEALAQTALLEHIAAAVDEQNRIFETTIQTHQQSLCDLARHIVSKICERLMAARETENTLALLDDYLTSAPDAATATFILAHNAPEATVAAVKKALSGRGMAKQITIKKSKSITPGECRIEWRGGALTQKPNTILQQIDEIFLSAHEAGAKLETRKATKS